MAAPPPPPLAAKAAPKAKAPAWRTEKAVEKP